MSVSTSNTLVPRPQQVINNLLWECVRLHGSFKFIPADKQHEIITVESISEILNETALRLDGEDIGSIVEEILPSGPDSNSATAQTASRSRRKIFGILLLAGIPEKIIAFIQKDIWDCDLPLTPSSQLIWERRVDSSSGKPAPERWIRDATWNSELELAFRNWQSIFLSPIFDMSGLALMHYRFLSDFPLPFTQAGPSELDLPPRYYGGRGHWDVLRVKIHPAHHNLLV